MLPAKQQYRNGSTVAGHHNQQLTFPISLDTVSDSLLVKQATKPICRSQQHTWYGQNPAGTSGAHVSMLSVHFKTTVPFSGVMQAAQMNSYEAPYLPEGVVTSQKGHEGTEDAR